MGLRLEGRSTFTLNEERTGDDACTASLRAYLIRANGFVGRVCSKRRSDTKKEVESNGKY